MNEYIEAFSRTFKPAIIVIPWLALFIIGSYFLPVEIVGALIALAILIVMVVSIYKDNLQQVRRESKQS